MLDPSPDGPVETNNDNEKLFVSFTKTIGMEYNLMLLDTYDAHLKRDLQSTSWKSKWLNLQIIWIF